MNIKEKIEQIRREPENIRIRWVWLSVGICMIFIIIIWIFSTITMFNDGSTQNKGLDVSPIKDQLQNLKSNVPSVPSIQDISGPVSDTTQTDSNQGGGQQTNDNSNTSAPTSQTDQPQNQTINQ